MKPDRKKKQCKVYVIVVVVVLFCVDVVLIFQTVCFVYFSTERDVQLFLFYLLLFFLGRPRQLFARFAGIAG